jgi:hypothetical protein
VLDSVGSQPNQCCRTRLGLAQPFLILSWSDSVFFVTQLFFLPISFLLYWVDLWSNLMISFGRLYMRFLRCQKIYSASLMLNLTKKKWFHWFKIIKTFSTNSKLTNSWTYLNEKSDELLVRVKCSLVCVGEPQHYSCIWSGFQPLKVLFLGAVEIKTF